MPDTTPTRDSRASDEAPREPLLRIVSGSPTPDEVAIIVAVMAGRGRPAEDAPQFSLWSRKSRQVRPSLRPGFGAWRASTMPR
ncbi:MAG: acyl-CoA carboxylase subunit epsilon [Actinomycetes bacterium]